MASLGFRRPQFSQEFAWLPTWLQNPQVEASDNSIKELQPNVSQVETFSGEEGPYNSLHLFLSGEDTSQYTLSPSPGNVLHLRLHLSSYGESQDSQSQDFYGSKSIDSSSKVLSVRQVETFANLQERSSQQTAEYNHHDVVKVSTYSAPVVVENVRPQSSTNNDDVERQCGRHNGVVATNFDLPAVESSNPSSPTNCEDNRQHEEKFNVKHIKDADISDAVELSIAASEALVIHDLMRAESTETVPTGVILEAALHVKQARFEAFKDGICCSSPEIDDISSLSDLDEQTMENAFIDVGLFFTDFDDQYACHLDMSQVKDTPALENHHVHNNGTKYVHMMAEKGQNSDDSVLGLNNCDVAMLVDPISDLPAEKISHVPAVAQLQVDVSSSPHCMSENAEVGVGSFANHRFKSRWLGGWQVKGADVSAEVKQKSSKGVPKFFRCETSFLSESAGVAADENSFVQRHETGSKVASQSSIPFEGVLDKADEVNCISQDVGSSNQSLVDPLCSVVPCSISTETADFPLVKNIDDNEDARNSFSTKSEVGMKNFQKVSNLNVQSGPGNGKPLPAVAGESSEATVKRKLASLKTYSMLLPKHDVVLSGQRTFQNQHSSSEYVAELLSSNHYGHIDSGSNKKNSKWHSNLRSEFEYSVGTNNGQNQEATVCRSPVVDCNEPSKAGAAKLQLPPARRKSPRVLNRRARCRLQPSELLEHLTPERIPEQVVAQGTISNALCNKNVHVVKSKLKCPHSAKNLVRKQVRFTDVEMELQQNKDIQKPQTSRRNCSATKANKRSKYSKPPSDCRTQDMNRCFTNHINDKKILIFQGLEFMLTGFSSQKEREIIRLINEHGGVICSDVPSPTNSRARRTARSSFQRLPIIICSKKLKTTKFLYGCAVNAIILKVKWLADSIAAGSLITPERYMILPNRAASQPTGFGKSSRNDCRRPIFDKVGVMLQGKQSFCTNLAIIIKHGGGQVFKTLQRLIQSLDSKKISKGAIIAEDDRRVSRHLRHCASERELSIMPASWIAKSLHLGDLLPLKEREDIPTVRAPESAMSMDWSQEI